MSLQPVPVFDCPQFKKKKRKSFFLFKWKILYFNLCPLPLVLSLDSMTKSLAWSSLHLPAGISAY